MGMLSDVTTNRVITVLNTREKYRNCLFGQRSYENGDRSIFGTLFRQ